MHGAFSSFALDSLAPRRKEKARSTATATGMTRSSESALVNLILTACANGKENNKECGSQGAVAGRIKAVVVVPPLIYRHTVGTANIFCRLHF